MYASHAPSIRAFSKVLSGSEDSCLGCLEALAHNETDLLDVLVMYGCLHQWSNLSIIVVLYYAIMTICIYVCICRDTFLIILRLISLAFLASGNESTCLKVVGFNRISFETKYTHSCTHERAAEGERAAFSAEILHRSNISTDTYMQSRTPQSIHFACWEHAWWNTVYWDSYSLLPYMHHYPIVLHTFWACGSYCGTTYCKYTHSMCKEGVPIMTPGLIKATWKCTQSGGSCSPQTTNGFTLVVCVCVCVCVRVCVCACLPCANLRKYCQQSTLVDIVKLATQPLVGQS